MNKKLIHRYYADLWHRWDDAVLEEIIAQYIEFRGSLGVTVSGRDGFRGYVAKVRAAFPDFHNRIDEIIAECDAVAARLTYNGTHRGELYGQHPLASASSMAG